MNFIEVNAGNGHMMMLNLDHVESIVEGAKGATTKLCLNTDEYYVVAEPYEDMVDRILAMQKPKK